MTPDLPREVVALVNGGPPGTAILTSRALHYGDGVFRTLMRHEGRWLDFDRHYVKLVHDCRALDLDPPHVGQLQAELEALGGGRAQPLVGKIILARAGGGRGYTPTTRQCDRILLRYPAPRFPASHWSEGVNAIRSAVTLAAQPRLAGVKHLNRLENVLAARAWPAGVQEALMCDAAGNLVCGTRSNLFWVEPGRLCTPKLAHCGVSGLMRARVLELARSLGLPVDQVEAPVERLRAAREAFITNSLIGLWPLRRLDDHDFGPPGTVSLHLQQGLAHPALLDNP